MRSPALPFPNIDALYLYKWLEVVKLSGFWYLFKKLLPGVEVLAVLDSVSDFFLPKFGVSTPELVSSSHRGLNISNGALSCFPTAFKCDFFVDVCCKAKE